MSVLDKRVKSGESPKFYKSGIASLEKRIAQLEHQVFCCCEALQAQAWDWENSAYPGGTDGSGNGPGAGCCGQTVYNTSTTDEAPGLYYYDCDDSEWKGPLEIVTPPV